MKTYIIKYQFFKNIKTFYVSAYSYIGAIAEFLRLNKQYNKKYILKIFKQ